MKEPKPIMMGQLPKNWNDNAKSITFCVTEDCNLACKYCYMTGKNTKNKMSFDVAKKTVDYILNNREDFQEEAVVWEFIGGEPFLEIDLIDRITDYIKRQMFIHKHPWFNAYRFNFSTNGLLYHTPKVQRYIWKNRSHLSIGISLDGNKVKHDLQRVKKDGSGSFEEVVKNVPLWLEQFPGAATKATFSHDDLPHLKDSVIALWDMGIKNVAANVVFEDVWQEEDDILFENQLMELADYIIDNKLYHEYSVRFFDPQVGNPLTEADLNANYCGAGKMLAIDCQGHFYPCIRFYDISLSRKKGYRVGDIYQGLNQDRLRPFHALTLITQSREECIHCEVGKGCSWCNGCNYDYAESDTIFQRAVYVCQMHKANVRANDYFWNKLTEMTGLPNEKERLKRQTSGSLNNTEYDGKFMYIMLEDNVTPHCSYRNTKRLNGQMPHEVLEHSLEFCRKHHYTPVFLGSMETVSHTDEGYVITSAAEMKGSSKRRIDVYDNSLSVMHEPSGNSILLVNKENLEKLHVYVENLISSGTRINLILEDIEQWNDDDLMRYEIQLKNMAHQVRECYFLGNPVEINVLTDLWGITDMCNCDAGETSYTIAPNGRIYICPAFYYEDPDDCIGTLERGLDIKNPHLLKAEQSIYCSSCDVYSCRRCKFLNKTLTGEISIPSKIQCTVSHLERKISMTLQKALLDEVSIKPRNLLAEIAYSDPLEVIKTKNIRTGMM